MTQETDGTRTLVARVQCDDHTEAWRPLSTKIRSHLRAHLGNRRLPFGQEFDDFYMEVLLRLLSRLPEYQCQQGASFWAWWSIVVDRIWVDQKRREDAAFRGGGRAAWNGTEMDAMIDDYVEDPISAAARREMEDAEAKALLELQAPSQEVYRLRRHLGLSYEEVARRIGGTKGAARQRFRLARKHILIALARDVDEFDPGDENHCGNQ